MLQDRGRSDAHRDHTTYSSHNRGTQLHSISQSGLKLFTSGVVHHHHRDGDVQSILVAHGHVQHAALVVGHDHGGSTGVERVASLVHERAATPGHQHKAVAETTPASHTIPITITITITATPTHNTSRSDQGSSTQTHDAQKGTKPDAITTTANTITLDDASLSQPNGTTTWWVLAHTGQ